MVAQEVEEQLEQVYEIDYQLQRLDVCEDGAMNVLKGIQVPLMHMHMHLSMCCPYNSQCTRMAFPAPVSACLIVAECTRTHEAAVAHLACSNAQKCFTAAQEELVGMALMRPEADAALAQRSTVQAAKAARRRKEEPRKQFREATTPNGLQVCSCAHWQQDASKNSDVI